jgi:hypothetical protein
MKSQKHIDLEIVRYSQEELYDLLHDNQTRRYTIPAFEAQTTCSRFQGFYFFAPHYLTDNNPDPQFIVAHENKTRASGTMVGVIKLWMYKFFPELPEYRAINFVDVREDRRRMGVATAMIRSINDFFTDEPWIVGTDETDMGKEAHLKDIIRRELKVCPYFANKFAYAEFFENNPGLLAAAPRK